MSLVNGHCADKFLGVKKLFEDTIKSGAELGASLVMNIDGEEVVDLWGGYKDIEQQSRWEEDTIINVFSSTKIVTSLAILMLIDQGKLDASAKVSKYWPEFGINGKENIEVRNILGHTSGMSGWDQPITMEDICDVKKSTQKLAAQAPWWDPGTASGYHAFTMGHLLGELLHRVTGKSLTEFIASEIAEPLGADFQIGAAPRDWDRICKVVPPPPMPFDFSTLPQDSVMVKTFLGPAIKAEDSWQPVWRNAEIGAGNGHGNARSLNRIASLISLQGCSRKKRQFLSAKTIDLIFEEQAHGIDLMMGHEVRFGTGYGLRCQEGPTAWFPKGKVCFWGGWGGSIVIMDLDKKITITYVMNKMGEGTLGNALTKAYVHELYKALGDNTVGVPWAGVAA